MVVLDLLGKYHKYLKYCVVGGLGALVDFSIYTVLVKYLSVYYIISNIISISVALVIVYYLQKNWTFQYKSVSNNRTFARYLLSVLLTYFLNNVVLFILVELFKYGTIESKIIQIILSTVWGYCLTNFFVFNQKWDNI